MIIAVEGADRTGKETLVKNLKDKFESQLYTVKTFEFPFNDFFTYKIIYWMLAKKLAKRNPAIFQFIQFLNKFFVQCVILIYTLFFDVIILDRWKASSVVYGTVGGCSDLYVNTLSSFLFDPTYTIIIGDKTYSREEEEDELEKDNEFQKSVKKLYLQYYDTRHYLNTSEEDSSIIKYFDNSVSKEELTLQVFSFIDGQKFTRRFEW